MMLATEARVDVFVETLSVPAVASHDGELLGRQCELPAGPWLAIVLDEIDVSTVSTPACSPR